MLQTNDRHVSPFARNGMGGGLWSPSSIGGCSMDEEQIREALNAHWRASAAGDVDAEHAIYDEEVLCEYPQSGERILGRGNLQALRSHHPGKPSGFAVRRILGGGDLWITEYIITYQGAACLHREPYGVPRREGGA